MSFIIHVIWCSQARDVAHSGVTHIASFDGTFKLTLLGRP